MRFKKRPRTVSLKHLASSFDRLLREVALGRTVLVRSRQNWEGSLVPISLKQRIALQRKRPNRKKTMTKAGKRW